MSTTETQTIYIPPNCTTLKDAKEPQIRLGEQGESGCGKTWAALTFPNPIICNFDRGLGAHFGREDVVEVPFYDVEFCKKYNPSHKNGEDLRDTVPLWMDKESSKIPPDHTLIFDGGTGLQNAYHSWMNKNKPVTTGGQYNEFLPWRLKIDWYAELFEQFKTLKCHFIYISHEIERADKPKPGQAPEYTGKIRPLLTGQFGDQLISHFTDWFRALSADKPKSEDSIKEESLKLWGMRTKKEFMEMCEHFKDNSIYYWQTESDDNVNCKSSSLVNFPRYIPADYKFFRKYMRTQV